MPKNNLHTSPAEAENQLKSRPLRSLGHKICFKSKRASFLVPDDHDTFMSGLSLKASHAQCHLLGLPRVRVVVGVARSRSTTFLTSPTCVSVSISVAKLGDFFYFSGKIFLTIVAQIFGNILGYFEIH